MPRPNLKYCFIIGMVVGSSRRENYDASFNISDSGCLSNPVSKGTVLAQLFCESDILQHVEKKMNPLGDASKMQAQCFLICVIFEFLLQLLFNISSFFLMLSLFGNIIITVSIALQIACI